jgi:hypothetical protein
MLIVLQSEVLNLLEPYGPLQAYNGIDLPLPQITTYFRRNKRNSLTQASFCKCNFAVGLLLYSYFGPESLKKGNHLEVLRMGEINCILSDLQETGWRMLTQLI